MGRCVRGSAACGPSPPRPAPSRRSRGEPAMGFAMTRQRFEELVGDALDLIPREFVAAMENVVILVEDRNPENPTLLGLYHGVALTERTSHYGGVLPDRITIYREAILDICHDEQDVVEEVAITVVHEIAHHFGIDDARLHELGWG